MSELEANPPGRNARFPLMFIPAGIAALALLIVVWRESTADAFTLAEESLHAGSAKTLTDLGKWDEAEEVYTELLERSRSEGQFETYYYLRANLRYRLERYDEAIADYLKAIEYDPDGFLYQARWNLAQAYVQSGQQERAIQEFRAFQEEYGQELPQFTSRVNMALHLLKE
jgi:tetratricopeptide (TPR) repeat protein